MTTNMPIRLRFDNAKEIRDRLAKMFPGPYTYTYLLNGELVEKETVSSKFVLKRSRDDKNWRYLFALDRAKDKVHWGCFYLRSSELKNPLFVFSESFVTVTISLRFQNNLFYRLEGVTV